MLAPPPPPPPTQTFEVTHVKVGPGRVFFGQRAAAIRIRLRSAGPVDVRVRIRRVGGRAVAKRIVRRRVAPGRNTRITWNGITDRGHVARDGRYRVAVGADGGRLRRVGSFVLRGHAYPVRGRHSFRGAVGEFGVPRNGGRTHEGFDINAACGTPVVAARAGRVKVSRYDPALYGNHVIIHARGERRDYWYAHLRAPARVRRGQLVGTGQRLGDVGATGNARTIGCHLHFELHAPAGPFDPFPGLAAWDRFS